MLKFPMGWADKGHERTDNMRTVRMKFNPRLHMESPLGTKLYTLSGVKLDGGKKQRRTGSH